MQTHSWMRPAGWLAGVAMVLVAVAPLRADGPPEPELRFDLIGPAQIEAQGEPVKLSDYWIGVGCSPVRGALRAQLNLPEGEGLLVEQVVPDSPAAKAGIEQYDVILKAGDKPLKKIQDLVDAADTAKENELTVELLHGGKSKQVKLNPAKRPDEARPEWPRLTPHEAFKEWMSDPFRAWEGGKQPWRFRFWGPGTVLPPDAKVHPPMPGNMSVTITKQGEEPAKIVVKQDGQRWEVTENELDKLPPKIRPHVERMLGRVTLEQPGRQFHQFDFVPNFEEFPRWEGLPEGRLDKRLEEMNRRIEQLRKSIDEMRERRPRLKVPAPKLEAPQPKQKQEQV